MNLKEFVNDWIRCGTLLSASDGKLIIASGKRLWFEKAHDYHPSFYFPDFFLKDKNPWFTHESYREISVAELLELLSSLLHSTSNIKWHSSSEVFFNETFKEVQKKIARGELKKAVPFVAETAEACMDQSRLLSSLKALFKYIQINPAFAYGFWNEREGMLGATPETLFRCNNQGLLETMACAGTKKITDDQHSLFSDSKELYEHDLVVQGITHSLSPYGKVTAGNLQLLKLPHLMHLVTPLSLQLQNQLPFQVLVEALHPTPALGAFPKEKGMRWLQEYEQTINRSRFGAPAGYFLPETMQSNCYVAIRNIQWKDGRMHIAAGCGVVAESQCDGEWAEINLKLTAIKEMLDL